MDNDNNDIPGLDLLEKLTESLQGLFAEAFERHGAAGSADDDSIDQDSSDFFTDPKAIFQVLSRSVKAAASKVDTEKLKRDQINLLSEQAQLLQNTAKALSGEAVESVIKEGPQDKRFGDKWDSHPLYSYMKQSYLLNAKALQSVVDSIEYSDQRSADRVQFYARQYMSAVSPTNSLLNPEVLAEIANSNGASIKRGMDNFVRDLERSPIGLLNIAQTDRDAFEVGVNLASTAGKVIYQNDLIQLIHYTPTQEKVFSRPLLFVPPFVNKFYAVDLSEKTSMIRWLLDQGYDLYLISWVNPSADLSHKGIDDYVLQGVVAALDVVTAVSGARSVNAVGHCAGGTLLSIAQAYLKAIGDKRIKTLTLLTALLDFERPGDMGHYIYDRVLPSLEKVAKTQGVFDGRIMGVAFNLLRENSLFWPFFVNNYLKGRSSKPFDIFYWNGDPVNITAALFGEYLQATFVGNKLVIPGGLEVAGVPIDLSVINEPSYILGAASDHIVLWNSAFDSAKLLTGPQRFVLTGSGHLAGTINSPSVNKYCHWVNEADKDDAELWRQNAECVKGSWWPNWHKWLKAHAGRKVVARVPGSKLAYPAIEDAPGSYVMVRHQ